MIFNRLLRPFGFVNSLTELDLKRLSVYNIKGIIFDIDNTLVPWGSWDIPEATKDLIKELKRRDIKCCLLSNTDKKDRAMFIGKELELDVISNACKPLPFGFLRAIRILGLRRENIISIGDQLFMDVLGSNVVGIKPILVKPLTNKDFITTRLLRLLERLILPKIIKEVEYFGDIVSRCDIKTDI